MFSTPTAVAYYQPSLALDTSRDWRGFDIDAFSSEFEWSRDPLNGYWDTIQPIEETLARKRGDCDDYMAVTASALLAETTKSLGVAFLSGTDSIIPDHAVTYTTDRVYSSGTIHERSLSEYAVENEYERWFTRTLRS